MFVRRSVSLACLLLPIGSLVIKSPQLVAGEINEVEVKIDMETPDPDGFRTSNSWYKLAGEMVELEVLYRSRVIGSRRVGTEKWPAKPIDQSSADSRLDAWRDTLHGFSTLMILTNYQAVQRELDAVPTGLATEVIKHVRRYSELSKELDTRRKRLNCASKEDDAHAYRRQLTLRQLAASTEWCLRLMRHRTVFSELDKRVEQSQEGPDRELLASALKELGAPSDKEQLLAVEDVIRLLREIRPLAAGGSDLPISQVATATQALHDSLTVLNIAKLKRTQAEHALDAKLRPNLNLIKPELKRLWINQLVESESAMPQDLVAERLELVAKDEEWRKRIDVYSQELTSDFKVDDEVGKLRSIWDKYLTSHATAVSRAEQCIDVDMAATSASASEAEPRHPTLRRLDNVTTFIQSQEEKASAANGVQTAIAILEKWRRPGSEGEALSHLWRVEAEALVGAGYTHSFVIKLRHPIPDWETDRAAVRVSSPHAKGWRFRVSVTGSLTTPESEKKKEVTSIGIKEGSSDEDALKITKEVQQKKVPKEDKFKETVEANSTVVRHSSVNGAKTYQETNSININKATGVKVSDSIVRGFVDSSNVVSIEHKTKTISTKTAAAAKKQKNAKQEAEKKELVEDAEKGKQIKTVTTTEVSRVLLGEFLEGGGPRVVDKDETETITTVEQDGEEISKVRTFKCTHAEPWLIVELLPTTKEVSTMGGELNYQPPGKAPADRQDPTKPHQHSTEYTFTFDRIQ